MSEIRFNHFMKIKKEMAIKIMMIVFMIVVMLLWVF
jgi:hypothetical protein